MPVAVWPGSLPQVALRDGYGVKPPEDVFVEREMEDGPPLRRRKRLSMWTEVSMSMILTTSQFSTLRTFWKATLNAGAEPFDMPCWDFSGASVTRRVYLSMAPAPQHITPQKARVSMTLKVRDFY